MKMIPFFFLIALTLISKNTFAFESGPGNGTDYVKILFSEAQAHLVNLAEPVTVQNIKQAKLSSEFKEWLTAGESPRWVRLKFIIKKIDLQYQEAPCQDDRGRQSSICFLPNLDTPTVLISRSENKLTTSDQAMAMLIHEAGHFLNEMDHLFLNDLGVSLVALLKMPRVFSFELESKEIVANVFVEKKNCETGESDLAKKLINNSYFELQQTCLTSNSSETCKSADFSFVLDGAAEWIDGRGFTQSIICKIKARLALKEQ